MGLMWARTAPRRLENRIGEPAANPYLYMASQILSGLDGVDKGLGTQNPPYSITSSARASMVAGMVTPIALAVLRLITSSNLTACSTGMSAGFSPRKILCTNVAARLDSAGPSEP